MTPFDTQGDVECVPTANQPTLTDAPVALNAVTVVENGQPTTTPTTTAASLTATIKRQVAIVLMRDLVAWREGDASRFSRMVDGRSAGLGSPDKWLRNLASICANPLVLEFYPNLPEQVAQKLALINLSLPATTRIASPASNGVDIIEGGGG